VGTGVPQLLNIYVSSYGFNTSAIAAKKSLGPLYFIKRDCLKNLKKESSPPVIAAVKLNPSILNYSIVLILIVIFYAPTEFNLLFLADKLSDSLVSFTLSNI